MAPPKVLIARNPHFRRMKKINWSRLVFPTCVRPSGLNFTTLSVLRVSCRPYRAWLRIWTWASRRPDRRRSSPARSARTRSRSSATGSPDTGTGRTSCTWCRTAWPPPDKAPCSTCGIFPALSAGPPSASSLQLAPEAASATKRSFNCFRNYIYGTCKCYFFEHEFVRRRWTRGDRFQTLRCLHDGGHVALGAVQVALALSRSLHRIASGRRIRLGHPAELELERRHFAAFYAHCFIIEMLLDGGPNCPSLRYRPKKARREIFKL